MMGPDRTLLSAVCSQRPKKQENGSIHDDPPAARTVLGP